ncbi:transposase family protein [Rothia nasisuis]
MDELLDSSTLADKGYMGLGLATSRRRKPGQRLTEEQRQNNRVLNRLRSVVERVIAQIKTWRVLHTEAYSKVIRRPRLGSESEPGKPGIEAFLNKPHWV